LLDFFSALINAELIIKSPIQAGATTRTLLLDILRLI